MVHYIVQTYTLLSWIFLLYAAVVSVFMILENQRPEKTIAWILLFFLLPVVGVAIYFMFGRDYHPFSRQDKLLQQEISRDIRANPEIAKFLATQDEAFARLKQAGPPVYHRVLALMRRNAQATLFPYNTLEILQNGTEKYPRLLEDLKNAQHSIHMEYFEWASDELMQKFKAVLLERAQAGVEVRVVYDALGCFTMLSRRYVREMNAGCVKMIPWSPVYAVHTISYRSHRKIVVIDSKIGYTGGLNMSEEYVKGPKNGRFTGWRDTHVRVTGQVVLGLQASFAVQWYNTTKEQLFHADYYPPPMSPPASSSASAPGQEADYLPLQIVHSGPDAEWKAIREVYFALITAAQTHIYIQSPFFILDEGLAEALAGAARSGVDVRVMIAPRGPGPEVPYWAGFTYAANMAKAGVKLYLYQGDYFHAKTICIDSVICSIGSVNMDIRSFSLNYELNLIVYDQKITKELEQDFKNDMQHCTQFDSSGLSAQQRVPAHA